MKELDLQEAPSTKSLSISFLGPGLWNANNSLGAGGALEPYLVNSILADSIGVKYTLILGTLGWAPYSASLYQNNRYGTEWFVIFAAVICGISAGLYWAAEGAIVLAYPEQRKRGRYLALWLAFKNSGQVIGGAINLGLNIHRSTGGKISYATLLTFVILQALAPPVAFLISNPENVQREDGTEVKVEIKTSTKEQLVILWRTVSSHQLGLLSPLFFASWFYWGYSSTFLTLYFSVRARALGSFLSAITGVIAVSFLGLFLDSQRWTMRHRTWVAGSFVLSIFTGLLIWAMILQHEYSSYNPGKLDWTTRGFGRGFGLYIMLSTSGNLVQNYLYWVAGSIGDGTQQLTRHAGLLRGVGSWGQCVSFGINSAWPTKSPGASEHLSLHAAMSIQGTSMALRSTSFLNLSKPFTPNSLKALRHTLSTPGQQTESQQSELSKKLRNAGVLIPLCNVNGRAGILFQVRAKNLRSHSGEVSFPGGRIDDTDASFLDGALRETEEELGIRPEEIDVLGEIGPPEVNLRGDMCVWPYIGFITERDTKQPESDDCPYPSLDLNQIRRVMSVSEVAVVFHVPLTDLTTPGRLRSYLFRGERPYWAVDVTDIVRSAEGHSGVNSSTSISTEAVHGETQLDEVGSGREGRVEIWGLTGWYLSLLLRRLQLYQEE
ncbi:hypothetical protein NP233_g3432 [Leucocoprinus birnbaumii]|uniref:Nudix hydrolase domain-containing protein n=1 Tax=Leucocoprinus birnbaumii TaxID=56174 RepID=A0AAD5VXX6_9AGAR|nr:hypothetical protein NP233_g3432 [Leucocoprinus birnbaumii]